MFVCMCEGEGVLSSAVVGLSQLRLARTNTHTRKQTSLLHLHSPHPVIITPQPRPPSVQNGLFHLGEVGRGEERREESEEEGGQDEKEMVRPD